MALHDGFPSASGVADANDIRLGLAGLVVRDTSGNPRTGIFPRHTNALVTSTATMNSAVAGFEACLSRSGQGAIFLANDGSVNVLHGAAPAANSRYDIVYTKQNDAVAPNADASSLPVFGVHALGASPSPTLPTYATAKAALDAAPGVLPGAEPLATVLIPSTATTMQSSGVVYTQLFQYTAAAGGTVWSRTKAELDLWTTAVTNQRAFVSGDGITYRFNGTSWKAWESGWITYAPTTIAGITLGTGGTGVYEYQYVHGDVRFKWRIQLGTGGTWSNPAFTLPSSVAAEHTQFTKMGAGALTTFSAFWEVTANYFDAATGVRVYGLGGAPLTYSLISASSPVAVSAGTVLAGRGQYTPA